MPPPYPLDTGVQALIQSAFTPAESIPVYKSFFLPSDDLRKTPNGYVFWDASDLTPALCSEGFAEPGGNESVSFSLDVACVAHDNTKRKALAESVLDVLQPTVSGRRTFLTSYAVPSTGVFIQYLRLEGTEETGNYKVGHSNPDVTLLVLSFSGKATC